MSDHRERRTVRRPGEADLWAQVTEHATTDEVALVYDKLGAALNTNPLDQSPRVSVAGRRIVFAALAEDREQWPLGHPCRNCGELAMDHPVENPTCGCEEWR